MVAQGNENWREIFEKKANFCDEYLTSFFNHSGWRSGCEISLLVSLSSFPSLPPHPLIALLSVSIFGRKEVFLPRSHFQALCYLAYGLLVLVIGSEYLIVLPYESHVRPSFLVPIYFFTGIYLIINIFYHYRKACSVDPGQPDPVRFTSPAAFILEVFSALAHLWFLAEVGPMCFDIFRREQRGGREG